MEKHKGGFKGLFAKVGFSLALVGIGIPLLVSTNASAGDYYTQDVQFYNLSSPNSSRTVTIPTHDFVNSVTTDTGNVSYTESGNNINLSVSGSPINGSAWSSYLYSTYTSSTISSSSDSFDSSISASSGGYSGTISKDGSSWVSAGTYIPKDTKEVEAQTSASYNSGGYSGTLTKYLYSGEYIEAASKTVSGLDSASYNKDGYTGTLTKYLYSGDAKEVVASKSVGPLTYTVSCTDYYEWNGSAWKDTVSSDGYSATFANTYSYNSGGYSGTLNYIANSQSSCTSTAPKTDGKKKGEQTTRSGSGTRKYSGTVYKYEDTRVYKYKGTVTKPASDTRVYKYKGTVTKPASDTRIYSQKYAGYIYMGGYYDTYTYNVKIGYTVNSAPTIDVNDASTADYFRGQTVSYGGTFKDSDTQDTVTVKWSLDNGTAQTVGSYKATNGNQPFNFNYTLPNSITTGTHTVRIWVEDNSNLSNKSSVISKTFTVNPFSTPNTPTYSGTTNGEFNITFGKGDNLSSTTYELYDVQNKKTIELGTANTYTETSLNPNTLHTYKVRSKNKIGEYSDYSSESSIYTLANAPTGGSVDDSTYTLNNGTAKLDWNSNGNTSDTKYHYEIRNKATNALVKSGDVNSTSTTVTGLPTDVRYTVTVNAVNGDGLTTSKLTIGEIYQDAIKPVASYSVSTSAWINGDVTISYSVTDSGTGVKQFTYPDGTVETATSGKFVATKNGTYTFTAVDNVGNKTVTDVVIKNIDKTAPSKPSLDLHNVPNSDTEVYFYLTDNGDGDGSGVRKYEYRMDGGPWTNYTAGSKVYAPTGRTGLIPVEARVTDGVGLVSDILLDYAIIDTTPPEIHSYDIKDEDGDGNYIFNVNATDDVGLVEGAGYMYYKKLVGVDEDFVVLNQDNGKEGWVGDAFINVPNTPSSSLYIYKATVRDYKNHTVSTKEVPYLTAPIFTYSGIKESGASNTATFELGNTVGEGVTIKVYREGNFVANIVSGNKFVDVGLNYDREYNYEFVAETTVDGKVVKSEKVKKKIVVKNPLIEATLNSEDVYKTPFTDEFNVTGRVAYQKGGKVSFKMSENGKQVGVSTVAIDAFATHDWSIKGTQIDDSKHTYDIVADLVGYEDTDVYKRTYKVTVSKRDVTVKDVTNYSSYGIYN